MGAETAIIALTVGSAINQYNQGIAEQQKYDRMAQMEELRGRQDAIGHRERGIMIMDSMLEQFAYANAYAGAGSVDPFSGAKLGASNAIFSKGIREFNITKYNAEIGIDMANYQASIYRYSGKMAKRQGITNAMMTLAQGAYMYNQVTPPSASAGSSASMSSANQPSMRIGYVNYNPQGFGPSMDIYR